MKIEFYIKNKKLKRRHSEEKIQLPKDEEENIILEFEFEKNISEKIYLLLETPANLYRFILQKDENQKYSYEVPRKLFTSTFFRVRLYTIIDEKKRVSNEVIIPIKKDIQRKIPKKGHLKLQYNNEYVECDEEEIKPVECDTNCKNYPDIFQYLLDITKESINKITIKGNKAYAYHEDDDGETLVQIIPLPNWVTKEELNEYISDTIKNVEVDEETGDIYEIKGELKFSEDT